MKKFVPSMTLRGVLLRGLIYGAIAITTKAQLAFTAGESIDWKLLGLTGLIDVLNTVRSFSDQSISQAQAQDAAQGDESVAPPPQIEDDIDEAE